MFPLSQQFVQATIKTFLIRTWNRLFGSIVTVAIRTAAVGRVKGKKQNVRWYGVGTRQVQVVMGTGNWFKTCLMVLYTLGVIFYDTLSSSRRGVINRINWQANHN
jgi:hypothetical protein